MKPIEQPLKALGIDPALVRGLSLEDAHGTVLAIGSALQKRWHPDRSTGDETRFKAVTAALEKIRSIETFLPWLEDFLKPRKNQLTELQTEVRKLQQRSRFYERRAQDYALAPLANQLTVLDRSPVTIHVVDLVQSELDTPAFRSNGRAFVQLAVAVDGSMALTRNKRTQSISRRLVGTLPGNESIRRLMFDSQPGRTDLIGAELTTRIDGLFPVNVPSDHMIGTNRLLLAHAAPIIRRLRPTLEEGSYLFSAQELDGEHYLYLEGRIHKIDQGAESV